MNLAVLALAALVPAMAGPGAPSRDTGGRLVVRLCNGGLVTIPFEERQRKAPANCHQKGCHAGRNRKRLDPAQ